MKLIRSVLLFACALVGATTASAIPPTGPGAAGKGATVNGSAWYQDNSPIRHAHVQLRDLEAGRVVATIEADVTGRFTFRDVRTGTFVVELVGTNGKIVTTGQPFVTARGEQVETFVRLGSKAPWFSGFFSNAAAAVASAAASQGITALAPVQLPVSAGSGR